MHSHLRRPKQPSAWRLQKPSGPTWNGSSLQPRQAHERLTNHVKLESTQIATAIRVPPGAVAPTALAAEYIFKWMVKLSGPPRETALSSAGSPTHEWMWQ